MLGCLVEKQLTTPQQYPLTANALSLACNQTTNREPVVALDDDSVLRALDGLKEQRLVRFVLPSHGRSVIRYRHVLDEVYGLDVAGLALLAILLLRGPQTPGELRARAGRMVEFPAVESVQLQLENLAAALRATGAAAAPATRPERGPLATVARHAVDGRGPDRRRPRRRSNRDRRTRNRSSTISGRRTTGPAPGRWQGRARGQRPSGCGARSTSSGPRSWLSGPRWRSWPTRSTPSAAASGADRPTGCPRPGPAGAGAVASRPAATGEHRRALE